MSAVKILMKHHGLTYYIVYGQLVAEDETGEWFEDPSPIGLSEYKCGRATRGPWAMVTTYRLPVAERLKDGVWQMLFRRARNVSTTPGDQWWEWLEPCPIEAASDEEAVL